MMLLTILCEVTHMVEIDLYERIKLKPGSTWGDLTRFAHRYHLPLPTRYVGALYSPHFNSSELVRRAHVYGRVR